MLNAHILEQVNQQVSEVIRNNPLTDVEKNLKSIVLAILNKLDLVTREEFETQQKVLANAYKKLEMLESRLEELKNTDSK